MPGCLCGSKKCDREPPPGSAGYFSDKSLRLYEDPYTFINSQISTHNSRTFLSRLALKQTIVLCSHSLIKHYLDNCMHHFYNGLKDNYSQLFGDSILFADADTAIQLRKILLPLFEKDCMYKYQDILKVHLDDWLESVAGKREINFYEEFKQLALTFNLEIFLGIHHRDDRELVEEFSQYSTEHWHGVVSVPLNIKIPFWGNSGYSTAMQAKERLLDIIKERLKCESSELMNKLVDSSMEEEAVITHLLLFSCALIPKAVGAILSILYELYWYVEPLLDDNGEINDDHLETILLEIARMYPPFIGGLRVASCDTTVGEYHVPRGTAVHYSLLCGMRDPDKFPQPDQFNPNRWRPDAVPRLSKDDLLCFGSGPHDCVGRHYSWSCIKIIAKYTLQKLIVKPVSPSHPEEGEDRFPKVKYLPCLRPVHPTRFHAQIRKP